MILIESIFEGSSRGDEWTIIPIGDIHIGALNCAEDKLAKLVDKIAEDPNAYWFCGGDACDAITLNDQSRFDPSILPDWIISSNNPDRIRQNLQDVLTAQKERFFDIMSPIRHKCLGLIEGNHEYAIMKHYNRNFMEELCQFFGAPNLTDCAFFRLKFVRKTGSVDRQPSAVVKMFVCHGSGGGRTSGAEPNTLYRLAADKDVDIVLKGHSHSFCIHPPMPMMTIPSRGELPDHPHVYYKYAANWGSFMYTYMTGPSTYASRSNFPVRPMYTVAVKIKPFQENEHGVSDPKIELLAVRL